MSNFIKVDVSEWSMELVAHPAYFLSLIIRTIINLICIAPFKIEITKCFTLKHRTK